MRGIALLASIAASACAVPSEPAAPVSPAPVVTAIPLQLILLETSYPALAGCGGVNAREWRAWLENGELIVEGEVGTKPSTALRLVLDPQIRESFPVQRTLTLTATMPTEPTIDMLVAQRVEGRWPIAGALGVVSIRCGTRILATIRDPRDR